MENQNYNFETILKIFYGWLEQRLSKIDGVYHVYPNTQEVGLVREENGEEYPTMFYTLQFICNGDLIEQDDEDYFNDLVIEYVNCAVTTLSQFGGEITDETKEYLISSIFKNMDIVVEDLTSKSEIKTFPSTKIITVRNMADIETKGRKLFYGDLLF